MNSFPNSTSSFDNLLLQSLMGRLQIGPQSTSQPFLSQSLEDLLFDAANGLSDDDEDSDEIAPGKNQLAREESKLEKEIVKIIHAGNIDLLKPNSGQAVAIGDHHICVGFHEEAGSDYRVWEWHGHIMLFDEEDGFCPEYIYGNYFERLKSKIQQSAKDVNEEEKDEEEKEDEIVGPLGLRELIDGGATGGARILHRNINASSPRLQQEP